MSAQLLFLIIDSRVLILNHEIASLSCLLLPMTDLILGLLNCVNPSGVEGFSTPLPTTHCILF